MEWTGGRIIPILLLLSGRKKRQGELHGKEIQASPCSALGLRPGRKKGSWKYEGRKEGDLYRGSTPPTPRRYALGVGLPPRNTGFALLSLSTRYARERGYPPARRFALGRGSTAFPSPFLAEG